nr:hypothetical protein [Tanacetum cinerariifolium]
MIGSYSEYEFPSLGGSASKPSSAGLFKEKLSRVPVWMKFHDVSLVAYISDGLSLISMKIITSIMLDSYTNSMCLKSWGRGSYARILIEIDAYNGFSNNLVMAVPNIDGLDDCPNAPKRVVNRVDKDKGRSSGVDGDGFIKVKRKKSGDNYGGTKNFMMVSVKPKTLYRHKVNQPTKDVSPKMTPSAGKKNVSRTDNSLKKTCKTKSSTSGNRTFSVSNSFEVLNVDNLGIEQVDSGNKASMSGVQEEGDHDSEDKVKLVDNEMESYLALEPSGDPHDDDMYEGNEIHENIQSICDNLDIKVVCCLCNGLKCGIHLHPLY